MTHCIWLGNDGKEKVRLDELSVGDILFFPDYREEEITDLKPEFGEVYTKSFHLIYAKKRLAKATTFVYELNSSEGIINANSKGRFIDQKMERLK